MKWLLTFLRTGSTDLVLVLGLIGILGVLFIPVPAGLLDFLLVTNFSFGLLILLLTLYAEKPLQFSTFPSLLLIATLFRLSLNIAATRLILGDAAAGEVIHAVGSYVVGGNYVIGLVIFLILVVIQYVVVTNGAQRVAEVAARFTLDSMPGKQMSIDADLNMGLIDEVEARNRRSNVEREANFYGAMDGATKFVKGDAIAGIIIILINIIGGLIIGVVQHGMPWNDALHTFTLLTVGDGIVTQIPSLVIAVATGLLITRAATDSNLGQELANQITAYPKAIAVVGCTLLLVMLLPGIPALPILMLILILGAVYWFSRRRLFAEALMRKGSGENVGNDSKNDPEIEPLLKVNPVEIQFGEKLFLILSDRKVTFVELFEDVRRKFAIEYGFLIPRLRLTDCKSIKNDEYRISINGVHLAKGRVLIDKFLAINPNKERVRLDGEDATEPTYGLPATWINEEQVGEAAKHGYTIVSPENVLATHYSEVLKRSAYTLLTRTEAEKIVNSAKSSGVNTDDLISNSITYSDVQYVLQSLLKERVSIRHVEIVIDAISDVSRFVKDKADIAEKVRERLGAHIIQGLRNNEDDISVLLLDNGLEKSLLQSVRKSDGSAMLLIEPTVLDKLMSAISKHCDAMMAVNKTPIILCTSALRKPLKSFAERIVPTVSVIGMNEIPDSVGVKTFATISVG